MQVKELKSEGLSYELEITISATDIDKLVDEKLVEVGKTVKMQGFRPGKVPMNILKKRYGKAVLGEVLEKAVNDNTAKAMDEKGLKPAMQPKIEVKEFDEGKDLVYTVAVDVLPTFELKDFKGLKLEKPVCEVADEKIDEALNNIASSQKSSKPIEGKRASKDGDITVINFKGRRAKDNKEVPGMSAEGTELELGSGMFIPGFEEQLVGKKAGEQVEVKVTFPENYGHEELAGEEAIFDVTIQEIREAIPAEINDDLAKKAGLADLEALKKAIRDQMTNEYGQISGIKLKRVLLDALDEQYDFDLPQSMVDAEFESIVKQVEAENHRGHHHAPGEKCDHADADLTDEDKEELRVIAERRVRLGLVLSQIGNENQITVADQDLQRAVIAEAQKYPGQEKQVFDFYLKNRQALDSLRAPIFEQKVVDFIVELAEVTEKKVTLEELTAEEEDEPLAKKKPAKKAAAKKEAGEKKAPAKKKAATKKA